MNWVHCSRALEKDKCIQNSKVTAHISSDASSVPKNIYTRAHCGDATEQREHHTPARQPAWERGFSHAFHTITWRHRFAELQIRHQAQKPTRETNGCATQRETG